MGRKKKKKNTHTYIHTHALKGRAALKMVTV